MKSALLPRAERRVGRLRVRAREESEARHASVLLADALRTASLPSADQGELLVVRKLSLGRISPFASSATLALQLELAMRGARLSAVHFASSAAPSANAVIFPSRAEALAALARSHARRIEPGEWFWSAAVTGWAAPLSRPARWRLLLAAAHELPEAAVASARIVREALRAGVEDELLNALPPGQGAPWLQLEGWTWPPPACSPDDLEIAGRETQSPSWMVRHHEVLEQGERAWGRNSDRLAWLATVLAIAENPARAADPGLVAATMRHLFLRGKIDAPKQGAPRDSPVAPEYRGPDSNPISSAKEAICRSPEQPGVSAQSNAGTPENGCADSSGISSAKESVRDSPEHARISLPPETRVRTTVESSLEVAKEDEARPEETSLFRYASTSFAGLLFLVPILERLGFAEFLAANPSLLESEFPPRLLRFVGARVGMLPNDPLALVLDYTSESEPVFPPAELPKAAREILARPMPRARLDSPLMSWTTALRRWSRRHARLGLRSLICRPGRLANSPTQLDIFFDLATADLRLRRVALDVDPGWVPWLARVVRFHYLEAHERGL